MSTEQCRRLRDAYLYARSRRQTKVIVLMGGSGLLLERHPPERHRGGRRPGRGVVAKPSRDRRRRPRDRRDRIASRHLGPDRRRRRRGRAVRARGRPGVRARGRGAESLLRHMGGLYGSEYWTYLLPRRVGAKMTARLTGPPFTPAGHRARPSRSGCWTRRSAQPRRASKTRSVPLHGDWPQTRT